MGTQNKRLNEMVPLSTQNKGFNLWIRKYFQFYEHNVCLSCADPKNFVRQGPTLSVFFVVVFLVDEG